MVCACVYSVAQSCPTLCDPIRALCSPLGSFICEIFQARRLEWVAISSFRECSQPRKRTHVSCIVGRFFTDEPPGKLHTLGHLFPIIFQTPEADGLGFLQLLLCPGTGQNTSCEFLMRCAEWSVLQIREATHLANTTAELNFGLQLFTLAHRVLGGSNRPLKQLSCCSEAACSSLLRKGPADWGRVPREMSGGWW